jgi:hypothetical protein
MLGGPHAAGNAAGGVLAYRTTASHIALYTQPVAGPSTWADLSPQINAPAPAADPIPFFDPSGVPDVVYIDGTGHLILLSANDPVTTLWHNQRRNVAWRPLVGTDLSALTGVTFANGLPSIQVNGQNGVIAARTLANTIEVISLTWDPGQPVPYLSGAAVNVSTLTSTGTATSDPVVLATPNPSVVTTSISGDLELYTNNMTSGTTTTTTTPTTTTVPSSSTTTTAPAKPAWVAQDLTRATSSPKVGGALATGATSSAIYVAAISASGNVELLSTPLSTFVSGALSAHATLPVPSPWTALNVTALATGAPPLGGALFLDATSTQLTVAGQASTWGDLFALSNTGPNATWVATDVSVTAGNAAKTVGSVVTGFHLGTTLDLFAAGIDSPPLQGVGVYAIPFAKWSQAITDGWPIISETGGMGTTAAPWVGFTSAKSVATSPDFLMGQNIYNSKKRVTWLSFWTVSGPQKSEVQQASTYFNHGFASGAWVATQIDQYRGLNVGLKPDWVIFDPEGFPDNHSGLDAPAGSSSATIAQYATYWTAMLQGWVQGIASVDPSLNAGVYASQSEYRNYSLASQPLPVFVALSFSSGGPVPVAGASGSNIRGFIAFSAVCAPVTSLKAEESTLMNPPWAGQFNTLQFNASVYCPPA